LVLVGLVPALLFLDLFVLHRNARVVPFKEALWMSMFWVSVSLAFGRFVWFQAASSRSLSFWRRLAGSFALRAKGRGDPDPPRDLTSGDPLRVSTALRRTGHKRYGSLGRIEPEGVRWLGRTRSQQVRLRTTHGESR
jgi:hypothetical protein